MTTAWSTAPTRAASCGICAPDSRTGASPTTRQDVVHAVAELEDFLKQATPRARDTLAQLLRVATERGFTPWALPEPIVEWLWLVLRRADAGTISLLRYADEIQYALNTLIGNPVPTDGPEET